MHSGQWRCAWRGGLRIVKERFLSISGHLWLEILKAKGEQHFRVIKNGLPEDAKCIRVDASCGPNAETLTLKLVLTSSVFQDSDPDELPAPILQSLYPTKGEYKPYGE